MRPRHAGADPTKAIEELAKRRKIRCLGVSMGQGQEVVARRHVAAAAAEGHWVLLQNTHLGLRYLSEVEQFLSTAEGLHEGFRLWITAEPHPAFPIGLLHAGVKVTNEAPVGLRAGLRASYQWLTQDALEAVNRAEWRPLLFALCFLHSVVQERRKFGPIGWNVPYEFSPGDLSACIQFLQNHVQDLAARKAPQPDWPTVRFMISTVQYGGRITDDYDRALMDAFAERFFHEGVVRKGHELFRDERTGASYAVPGERAPRGRRGLWRGSKHLGGPPALLLNLPAGAAAAWHCRVGVRDVALDVRVRCRWRRDRGVPLCHRGAARPGGPRSVWAARQRRPLLQDAAGEGELHSPSSCCAVLFPLF
jgi:hypothetical protein